MAREMCRSAKLSVIPVISHPSLRFRGTSVENLRLSGLSYCWDCRVRLRDPHRKDAIGSAWLLLRKHTLRRNHPVPRQAGQGLSGKTFSEA